MPAGVQGSAFAQFVAAKPATPVGQALDGAGALDQPAHRHAVDERRPAVASDADDRGGGARSRREAPRAQHHGHRLSLPDPAVRDEKVFRFPVLAHWSFTTNEGATFETLMQDVDVGLLGAAPNPTPKKATLPGQPDPLAPPPRPEGPEIVETGHIGLDHTHAPRRRRCEPGTAARACRFRRRATAGR